MAAPVRISVARMTSAACLLGAGLGAMGRWPVILEGFGSEGGTRSCRTWAFVGYVLYLSGMSLVLLLVEDVGRRLQYYGMVSFAAMINKSFLPTLSVGKTLYPGGICMCFLFVSGVVFLAVGTIMRFRASESTQLDQVPGSVQKPASRSSSPIPSS
ncbi:MAG: hypothetical protein AB7I30_16060 [Isosphaeraceae bacterium]